MNIFTKISFLRVIIIILLIFILFNFTFDFFISRRKKIFIFLDSSLSMADERKFSSAIDFLELLKKELTNIKIFSFGETIKEISQTTNLSFEEKRTDFKKVLDFSFLKKPDILLILSDGLHNTGNLSFSEKMPFSIFTIGFGLPQICDFSFLDVNYPNFAFVKETVKIFFRIKSDNLKGLLPVSLIANEKILEKKEMNFTFENVILEDSFKVVFQEEGKNFLTLKIPEIKEEIDYLNNQAFLTIEIKKKMAKILYISNQPTFNLRFIKRILEENPDYQTHFWIAFDKKRFSTKTDKYEVLIFDNFDFGSLSANEKIIINNLIKKAKGVLFLVDENTNFADFTEYLPIFPEKNITQKEIYFLLTEKGKESIIFEGLLTDIFNLPPFSGYLKGRLKENCQALLLTEKDSSPLLSYHSYQNKIIALFAGYPFWRWLFIPDERLQKNTHNFFLSLIPFLKEGNYRINIDFEKEFYHSDEEIKIKVLAFNEIGKPAKDLNILYEIPQYGIKEFFNEISDGLYQVKLFPPDTGEISLKISSFKDKEMIKESYHKIKVLEELEEKKTPYLDTLFLKKLAEISNGGFYLYPNTPSFSFLNLEKKKINFKIYFQNNFYIYLLLISLYILDIYLRKRKGLA